MPRILVRIGFVLVVTVVLLGALIWAWNDRSDLAATGIPTASPESLPFGKAVSLYRRSAVETMP
jgi:hypothetical protein